MDFLAFAAACLPREPHTGKILNLNLYDTGVTSTASTINSFTNSGFYSIHIIIALVILQLTSLSYRNQQWLWYH